MVKLYVGYLKPDGPMKLSYFVIAKGKIKPLYIYMTDSVKSLTVKKILLANTFPDGEINHRGIDYGRQTMLGPLSKRRVDHLVADSQLSGICCCLFVYRPPVGERGNARPRVADGRLPAVYPRLLPLPMVQVNARRLENQAILRILVVKQRQTLGVPILS